MAKKEIVDTISASAGISKKDTAAVIFSLLAAITAPAMKGALSGSQPLVHLNRVRVPLAQDTIPLPVPQLTSLLLPFRFSGPARHLRILKKQPKAGLTAQKYCRPRF